ncbi:hypothetical protein F9K75_05105 [Brucella intermedia]|nr:hypothetical protein F9K75_05105 [Brucella intermedia]
MLVSSCYEHRISPSKGGFKRGCAGKTGSNREKQNSCQLAEAGKLTSNFVASAHLLAKLRAEDRRSFEPNERLKRFIQFAFYALASRKRSAKRLIFSQTPTL